MPNARQKGGVYPYHRCFEDVIGNEEANEIETEPQRAAKRLLETLIQADSTDTKHDKKLIREHVKRKFT